MPPSELSAGDDTAGVSILEPPVHAAFTLFREVQQASGSEQAWDICGRRGILERLFLLLATRQAVPLRLRQDVVTSCWPAQMQDAAARIKARV